MIKKMEYECKRIEDVVLDLADEIQNGWRIYSIGPYTTHCAYVGEINMTIEVTLRKD